MWLFWVSLCLQQRWAFQQNWGCIYWRLYERLLLLWAVFFLCKQDQNVFWCFAFDSKCTHKRTQVEVNLSTEQLLNKTFSPYISNIIKWKSKAYVLWWCLSTYWKTFKMTFKLWKRASWVKFFLFLSSQAWCSVLELLCLALCDLEKWQKIVG